MSPHLSAIIKEDIVLSLSSEDMVTYNDTKEPDVSRSHACSWRRCVQSWQPNEELYQHQPRENIHKDFGILKDCAIIFLTIIIWTSCKHSAGFFIFSAPKHPPPLYSGENMFLWLWQQVRRNHYCDFYLHLLHQKQHNLVNLFCCCVSHESGATGGYTHRCSAAENNPYLVLLF